MHTGFGWGTTEGKRPLGRSRRRIILTWTFNKWGGSEQEQVAGSCERGNEPSGSIKCGEFLDYLRNC